MRDEQTPKPVGLTPDQLSEIVQRYSEDRLLISSAYADGGVDPLWGRFEGGVINQIENGDATAARYAIWANTVRDNIVEAIQQMEAGDQAEAKRLLVRAANSLSAFSDVQAYFDPLELGERQ
jgi:hypothetical protein